MKICRRVCRTSAARQTVSERPVSHPSAKEQRRLFGAIHRRVVQPLSVDGLGPDVLQGSPHHAALEEARQPAGAVEAFGAPRRPAATRLPEIGWAAPGTTVGLPSSSLDGDSCGQNPLRHSLGARHWRPLYADTSGLVSRVRHRRPRHSSSPPGGLLWPWRYRVELVQVISQRS